MTVSFSPRMLTSVTSAGIETVIGSEPTGATAFTPPGPAPPEMRSSRSSGTAEFGGGHRSGHQRVVERQHADAGRVRRETSLLAHLIFRIRVAVVQVEAQRQHAAMRRELDEDALRRIAAGQHVAEIQLGLDAHAKRRRARQVRRRLRGLHHRGGASLHRRGCLLGLPRKTQRRHRQEQGGDKIRRLPTTDYRLTTIYQTHNRLQSDPMSSGRRSGA